MMRIVAMGKLLAAISIGMDVYSDAGCFTQDCLIRPR